MRQQAEQAEDRAKSDEQQARKSANEARRRFYADTNESRRSGLGNGAARSHLADLLKPCGPVPARTIYAVLNGSISGVSAMASSGTQFKRTRSRFGAWRFRPTAPRWRRVLKMAYAYGIQPRAGKNTPWPPQPLTHCRGDFHSRRQDPWFPGGWDGLLHLWSVDSGQLRATALPVPIMRFIRSR